MIKIRRERIHYLQMRPPGVLGSLEEWPFMAWYEQEAKTTVVIM